MPFDFHNVHSYSVEELFGFIVKGEVTFPELQSLGVNYLIQQQLRDLLQNFEEKKIQESQSWNQTVQMAMQYENLRNFRGAINAYKGYLQRWPDGPLHPDSIHVQMANAEIERLLGEIEGAAKALKQALISDMRERPDKFTPLMMRYIMGRIVPNPDELDQSPVGRFLAAGLSFTFEELVKAEILPDIPVLWNNVLNDVWSVPQLQMRELGTFPSDRNDVFFMGVKGSGKTCALAGIINELYESGEVTYQPQINDEGRDLCQEYYYALIEAVRHNKALAPTATDTISFMKLDVGKKREKALTMVEMSGEAFSSLAQAHSAREVWENMGASSCLRNNNNKVLCFLIDYSRVLDSGRQDQQDIDLNRALTVLSNDGPNPSNPSKGCTMSKVTTVAIVVTKSDLMGPNLSYEQRTKIATEYVKNNLAAFVGTLKLECEKHGINAPARNQIYVFPYSLGDFYVGQTLQFRSEDSARFVEFLKSATVGKKKLIADIFK